MTSLLREHRIKMLSPVGLTTFLVLWTALWRPFSYYGHWAVWPALAVLPLAVAVHVYLLCTLRPKLPLVAYAAVHLLLLASLWIGCLMLISHDSL
jgi:hypothetical protein